MPHSFVIDFASKEKLVEYDFLEKSVHGMVFNIMKTLDKKLSTEIHDQIKKCITIRKIYSNEFSFSLRITLLNDDLFSDFSKILIYGCVSEFNLNGKVILIKGVKGVKSQESFWSDYTSYDDFFTKKYNDNFSFRIVTPMFFKKGDIFAVLPNPIDFFGSLLRTWNLFSTTKIEGNFLEQVEKNIFVASCDIKTDIAKTNRDISFVGVIGTVKFKTKVKDQDFLNKLLFMEGIYK